ncbi:transport protein [Lapidilactobacillus dextrinicus DSM 20335]|uniref:Transport protein n=1 Tax=Lapidilactobacillus dextrinicus DSM 20335 TaxID=1423738 RepID=A0A0R2BUM7_9LACO|nr:MFS transporter [Lapidilactobacillus dextrinicus]KRM79203.1 transport protein [Lapidilactobacillus dextrinicus DSM 20335]QFG46954.1 MFS transporter [Lapidilactobacillus dextrinicus]
MKMKSSNKYLPTALILYFSYAMLGIASSILSQYKIQFAEAWGATTLPSGGVNISMVVSVVAAFGLGRIIAYPVAGLVSDKLGRRISGLIGVGLYAVFFFGIAFSRNYWLAYAIGVLNGVANSFLDTCVSPSLMEMFPQSASIANLFTKFAMATAQFLLPFLIGWVALAQMSYHTIFIVCGTAMLVAALLLVFLPFPNQAVQQHSTNGGTNREKKRMRFTPASLAAIMIGFTSSTTFMLWLNCNQELGASYGVKDPSILQSFYAAGAVLAVLVTARLIHEGLAETTILILYPSIAVVMLILCYFIQTPLVLYIGSFVIGYSAAGGVLQLATSTTIAFFPQNKGTATSLVMIASSVANYVVLSLAAYITKLSANNAPRLIILLNIAITIIGISLAIVVKYHQKKVSLAE